MAASKQRVFPQLRQTAEFHGPNRAAALNLTTTARTGVENATVGSTNWSGVVNLSQAAKFNETTSFQYVFAEFVVPVANQAYGACTGGWDYSSSWAGIDGWGSNDVLQAGTESDAYCNNGTRATFYAAWVEWYPYGSVQISTLPVAPGDDVYVAVWNTSATQGHVYFVNYTTNQAVEGTLTPPPGTALVGNSVEWVVERPGVNGSIASVGQIPVADYFSACEATTWGGTTVDPGKPVGSLRDDG